MTIYDFDVTTAEGKTYSLEKYRGNILIIVNTATKCGFAPQFTELEALYQRYQAQGLVVLGFPSNQFKQELDNATDAQATCQLDYGVTFHMHELVTVNGSHAAPLFHYLTKAAPGTLGKSIKWNFTKFLVDRDGQVVERFAPKTAPDKMIPSIEKLL